MRKVDIRPAAVPTLMRIMGCSVAPRAVGPLTARFRLRKALHRTPTLVLPAFAVLLGTAVTAQASTRYIQTGSIPAPPAAEATFASPLGSVAVDRSSGDVYVVDGGHTEVQKFDASGTFILSFGGGVDQTSGANVCAAASGDTCGPGTPGSGNGQFACGFFCGPEGIAVDQASGDVYVTDPPNSRVQKFDSSGKYLSQFDGSATPAKSFSSPSSVSVDPTSSDVYVVDAGHNVVDKFDSSGNLVSAFGSNGALDGSATPASSFSFPTFPTQPAAGVAVDSSGRLYVGDAGHGVVDEFDSSGAFQGQLGAGTLTAPSELAVDSSDNVFVVDSSSQSIVKFDSAGNPLTSFSTNTSNSLRGVAVTGDSHTVYVSTTSFSEGPRVLIFSFVTVPDVTTGAASNVQQTTATLAGTVNPDGVQLTDCHFVYTDDADFQANGYSGPNAKSAPCVPAAASIPPDHGEHAVTADLTGLSPKTTYDFRLVAANANGSNHGQDRSFRTSAPPVIDSTSFTGVALTRAILNGQVNPEGSDTTFHFEYGTTTAYGTSAPVPDGDLGGGSSDQVASTTISGLSPGTTYHFRLVAHNGLGTTDGPDFAFTTFEPPQPGLPDGRAYELVTPQDKNGQSIAPLVAATSAVAVDGGHVLYFTQAAFGDQTASGLEGVFNATRNPAGWQSTSVALPQADPHPNFDNDASSLPSALSPDFSSIYYEPAILDPLTSQATSRQVWVRKSDGTFVNVSQNTDGEAALGGSSSDGSHVALEMGRVNSDIVGPFGTHGGVLSLFDHTGDQNRPVGVDTSGSPVSSCGSGLAGTKEDLLGDYKGYFRIAPHQDSVSADGSRIFFEAPDPQAKFYSTDPNCLKPAALYVRERDARTTEISLSQKTGSVGAPAADGATFMGATPDGSKVFFYSPDQLTDDPAAASGGLYRFDVDRGTLALITNAEGATVLGSVKADGTAPLVSADGSHVYFRGSVPGNGPPGKNIYLWNDGEIIFVAPDLSAVHGVISLMSADGATLSMLTAANLTSYDSSGKQEVYLYRQNAGPLTCISCAPNGAAAGGDAEFYGNGNQKGEASADVPVVGFNNMTADGSRVVFDSPDRLLAGASNGLYNVYEWEASGTGSCNSSAHDGGCLYLLSDGSGPYESRLVGISRDGTDVVFATSDSLVPQDNNNTADGDLYDARIGGGFPFTPPSTPCSEDQCQGTLASVPTLPSAASITFSGAGNASPAAQPARAGVTVTGKTVTGSKLTLSVTVPGGGRITGSGPAVKGVSRTAAKAGTYQLTFSLTGNARRALTRHRKLKVTVRVAYSPPGAATSWATVSLMLTQRGHTTHRTIRAAHANGREGK
jgi:DNA-binding beta-propeller fold protein YncE